MPVLKVGPSHFQPALIIFDKDGTLIDFDSMWAPWIIDLASRLEAATQTELRASLYNAFGFDPEANHVLPEGKLAITPMALLYGLTIEVLTQTGLTVSQAEDAVAQAWFIPDPVALAQPVTHLPTLFSALRALGLKIAIATTDDRTPTLTTLQGFGVTDLVDTLVCADDGIPVKPAPDMILTICQRLNVEPGQTIMVGDALADLQMGRAAGTGLVVGVLTGVSPAATLSPQADVILNSIAGLV